MQSCNKRGPVLDERLQTAAALVLPGLPVADVGCDHGKLAAYLLCAGLTPRVIATDLRPGPLAKAEQTLRRFGCEAGAQLRLGNGLSVLAEGEVATVVIAGVSAETTIEICEGASWLFQPGAPRLVLIPATRHARLRAWLARRGFALVQDVPVQAAGRWYAVMAAEYTGEERQLPLRQCVLGDTGRHPGGPGYARHEVAKLRKYRRGLAPEEPLAAEMDCLLQEWKEEPL